MRYDIYTYIYIYIYIIYVIRQLKVFVQILLDCSQLHLVQCQYWKRSRYDVWYWLNRYDSARRCILCSVGVCNSPPLSVSRLLLKRGSQVFCEQVSRSVQVSHSAATLHLKHASLRQLYEWNIFRSASHHKNREVTHPVGCNC